jgi:NADH-quinone oxidoreductase subunit M
MILTWLILIPMVGGALAWAAGRVAPALARWIALAACVVDLGVASGVCARFYGTPGSGAPLLEQHASWIPQLGISYHLALDGLSLLLVLLTALLGVVAVAASWREITTSVGGFYFTLLAVLSGVTGVFLSRDLLLFYFFWELMLVPMYFLIGIWGHERRVYAAIKFFLFTFISSLLMLAAILGLVFLHLRATSVLTFDSAALLRTPLSPAVATWLMLGFFVAFAVKLPAVPVHTWLGDAHTEAPTGGSILLAGLLLKTGAYGMIRFAVQLFPDASSSFSGIACILGVAGILYGAMLAFAQTDLKRMVAYSSISHMGFVLLGIYAGPEIAVQGAVVQIIAHGLSTPALFLLAGSIQERCRTRELERLGGLWQTAPRLGGFVLFFAVAAVGLPGMVNFVGEFMVLLGAYDSSAALGIVGSLGFILSVVYALRLVQESVHGPNVHQWRLSDLSGRELAALGVLALLVVALGLWPQPIFAAARSSLAPASVALAPRAAAAEADVAAESRGLR